MKKSFRKIFAILAVVTVLGAMCIPFAFAVEGDSANDASAAVSAISSGFSQITGTLKISNLIAVLGVALGSAVAFFFFWWGIRKVVRAVTAAFKKGRISV